MLQNIGDFGLNFLNLTTHVGVHRLFAFHISVFFRSLFTCDWISSMFLLYDRRICTHSIDPSLNDAEFPSLGLAPVPDVMVPEAKHGVHMKAEISFQISTLVGV